ncbi:hypothetical protein TGVAND_305635 [Toxoplasma gondii VAND]|uniref:Uncharacterized protein n=1 Tax=Toxoplasma gondii VAND TaxID=933077 RepID=A0A086PQK1_TOXGO|nr:hypothetical protein TGVAND_305635 [Toxoplasma gondii VAND]
MKSSLSSAFSFLGTRTAFVRPQVQREILETTALHRSSRLSLSSSFVCSSPSSSSASPLRLHCSSFHAAPSLPPQQVDPSNLTSDLNMFHRWVESSFLSSSSSSSSSSSPSSSSSSPSSSSSSSPSSPSSGDQSAASVLSAWGKRLACSAPEDFSLLVNYLHACRGLECLLERYGVGASQQQPPANDGDEQPALTAAARAVGLALPHQVHATDN